MTDIERTKSHEHTPASAKLRWETPALDVLPIMATQNNGTVAPGDDIFSPSPTGS